MPPHSESSARIRRWPRSRRAATALAGVLTFAALFVTLGLALSAVALERDGRLATAVVTSSSGKWFDADLHLPDGTTVHASGLELANLSVVPTDGLQFTALYDPADPSNLVDAESGPDWTSPVLCGLITVVLTGLTVAAARGVFTPRA